MARQWLDYGRGAIMTALVTLVLQWAAYWLGVRDDIRDLKHDMADVKCSVAIVTNAPTLPPGCYPRVVAGAPIGSVVQAGKVAAP